MSDLLVLEKGARVFARRLGKADIRGKVTWVGPSKYGGGFRYGVKADDGSMHWVDGADIEREPQEGEKKADAFGKGARVRVTEGPHAGVEGEVYTASSAARIGIRDDNEDTYWVDRAQLELA